MDYSNTEDVMYESYLGKSQTLIEAEETIGELISLMKANPTADYTTHPLNKKLQSLLEKQFGFRRVYISWRRSPESLPMVGTPLSADIIVHGRFTIEKSKERGFYDKSYSHICLIQASSTLTSQLDLTAEEYLAILLHEIGHNFDYSVYMIINTLMEIAKKVIKITINPLNNFKPTVSVKKNKILPNVLSTTGVIKTISHGLYYAYEKIVDLFPILKKIMYQISRFGSMVTRGIEGVMSIPMLLALPIEVILSPICHLIATPTRKSEEFADSFAATYGYGVPLSRALTKLGRYNLIRYRNDRNSLRNFIRDTTMTQRYLLETFIAPDHGTADVRILSQIQQLKKDALALDFPPDAEQELLSQISEMEKMYDDYKNGIEMGEHVLGFTAYMRKAVINVFDGRNDFIAKLFPSIDLTLESYEDGIDVNNIKLQIYESAYIGDITDEEKDILLEKVNLFKKNKKPFSFMPNDCDFIDDDNVLDDVPEAKSVISTEFRNCQPAMRQELEKLMDSWNLKDLGIKSYSKLKKYMKLDVVELQKTPKGYSATIWFNSKYKNTSKEFFGGHSFTVYIDVYDGKVTTEYRLEG